MGKIIGGTMSDGRHTRTLSGFATRTAMVPGFAILMCLFTCVSALGVTTVKTDLDFVGIINGYPAEYSGTMIMDVGTKHCVCNLLFSRDFHSQTGTVKHLTKQTRGNHLVDDESVTLDLTRLTGGAYNVTTKWIESDGDTLILEQDVSSTILGDTMYVTSAGVWSGTCAIIPNDATVLIEPIHELWHQVGTGHMQGTYWQYGIIDGNPDTLQVIKDYIYAGSNTLPFDEILTISNYEVQFDEGSQVEHSEYDLSLSRAWGPIPSLSQWGMIILAFLLLLVGIIYYRLRQKAPNQAV